MSYFLWALIAGGLIFALPIGFAIVRATRGRRVTPIAVTPTPQPPTGPATPAAPVTTTTVATTAPATSAGLTKRALSGLFTAIFTVGLFLAPLLVMWALKQADPALPLWYLALLLAIILWAVKITSKDAKATPSGLIKPALATGLVTALLVALHTSFMGECVKDGNSCLRKFNSTQPSGQPKRYGNLPTYVRIPHCTYSWSRVISIPGRLRVTWEFNAWPVETKVIDSGRVKIYQGDPGANGKAVQFCTYSPHHADQMMPLTWLPY